MMTYLPDDVRHWNQALIAHSFLRESLPISAGASYPSLELENGELVLHAFHIAVHHSEDTEPDSYAILSRMKLKATDLSVLSYTTSKEDPLFPDMPLQIPFEPVQAGRAERIRIREELPPLFADLATLFVANQPAGPKGSRFLQTYGLILPASLMPYYKALNPSFFAWLQRG
jgi:hypothetical protein